MASQYPSQHIKAIILQKMLHNIISVLIKPISYYKYEADAIWFSI